MFFAVSLYIAIDSVFRIPEGIDFNTTPAIWFIASFLFLAGLILAFTNFLGRTNIPRGELDTVGGSVEEAEETLEELEAAKSERATILKAIQTALIAKSEGSIELKKKETIRIEMQYIRQALKQREDANERARKLEEARRKAEKNVDVSKLDKNQREIEEVKALLARLKSGEGLNDEEKKRFAELFKFDSNTKDAIEQIESVLKTKIEEYESDAEEARQQARERASKKKEDARRERLDAKNQEKQSDVAKANRDKKAAYDAEMVKYKEEVSKYKEYKEKLAKVEEKNIKIAAKNEAKHTKYLADKAAFDTALAEKTATINAENARIQAEYQQKLSAYRAYKNRKDKQPKPGQRFKRDAEKSKDLAKNVDEGKHQFGKIDLSKFGQDLEEVKDPGKPPAKKLLPPSDFGDEPADEELKTLDEVAKPVEPSAPDYDDYDDDDSDDGGDPELDREIDAKLDEELDVINKDLNEKVGAAKDAAGMDVSKVKEIATSAGMEKYKNEEIERARNEEAQLREKGSRLLDDARNQLDKETEEFSKERQQNRVSGVRTGAERKKVGALGG